MAEQLLEFETMTDSEMYRMVHEIYAEANLENAQWKHPELNDYTDAFREEEKGFVDFVRRFLHEEKNRYYVLEADGRWVSALRLTKLDNFYYLEALETAQQHRKQGYAHKLIDEVITLLRSRGNVTIRSNVHKENIPSLATHKKCGFVVDEENGINYLTGTQSECLYGMLYSK